MLETLSLINTLLSMGLNAYAQGLQISMLLQKMQMEGRTEFTDEEKEAIALARSEARQFVKTYLENMPDD